jgi:hypothetical protein
MKDFPEWVMSKEGVCSATYDFPDDSSIEIFFVAALRKLDREGVWHKSYNFISPHQITISFSAKEAENDEVDKDLLTNQIVAYIGNMAGRLKVLAAQFPL